MGVDLTASPNPAEPMIVAHLWKAFAVACGGILPITLVGAFAVQLRNDIGLTEKQLGLCFALYFGASAATAAVGGRVTDRLGAGRALALAAVFSSACLLVIGAFASTPGSLMVFLVIGGISNAVSLPATILYLSEWMPHRRLGLAFALKQTAGPFIGLVGGLAVPVVGLGSGWRAVYLACAALPLSGLFGFGGGRTAGIPAATGTAERSRVDRRLYPLAAAGGLAMLSVSALNAFMVVSAVEAGLSLATAGALLAGASIASIVGRLLGGWLLDRTRSDGRRPSAVLLLGTGLALLLLATMNPVAVMLGAVISYAIGRGWQGIYMYSAVETTSSSPAVASGTIQMGMALGMAIGPALFGLVVASRGYSTAWLAAAVAALAGGVMVMSLSRPIKQRGVA